MPVQGKKVSGRRIEQLWVDAGGPPKIAPVIKVLAGRESGRRTRSYNVNSDGSIDRGLLQINSVHGFNPAKLYRPRYNLKAAVKVYKQQGLGAWTTYKPSDRQFIGTGPTPPNRQPRTSSTGGGGMGELPIPETGGTGVAALLQALQSEQRPTPSSSIPTAPTFSGRKFLAMPQLRPQLPASGAPQPKSSISDLLALAGAGNGPDGLPQPESVPGYYQNAPKHAPIPNLVPQPKGGKVTVAPTANRPGIGIKPKVLAFARKVAAVYGHPLTIGTGTNHSQYVAGTHRQSEHWDGNAVDIPASGAALTRLGQAALIAGGIPEAQAKKMKGGIYNLPSGHQVIFNSNGHWDHLHASTH